MAQDLHITFKAGLCDAQEKDTSSPGEPRHIKPLPAPGYVYLFTEDDLMHFCWRKRSASLGEPDLDLIMFSGDASFKPYTQHGSKHQGNSSSGTSSQTPTNGRLYVLSFSSSSDRHFFWLQSKTQSPSNDASWHSPRDLKIAELVNKLLAGEEVDVQQEIAAVSSNGDGPSGGGASGDTAMEDADDNAHAPDRNRSGGAGATGGNAREEGEGSREGGADGGRSHPRSSERTSSTQADTDRIYDPEAQAAFINYLQTMNAHKRTRPASQFTTLPELLPPTTTLAVLSDAPDSTLDQLLAQLPPTLLMLAAGLPADDASDPEPDTVQAISMSLEPEQKRTILVKVLRSPQFSQSLTSLNMALRDGGLPSISDALRVSVVNAGFVAPGAAAPLAGPEAVRAFLDGVKAQVQRDLDTPAELDASGGAERRG